MTQAFDERFHIFLLFSLNLSIFETNARSPLFGRTTNPANIVPATPDTPDISQGHHQHHLFYKEALFCHFKTSFNMMTRFNV